MQIIIIFHENGAILMKEFSDKLMEIISTENSSFLFILNLMVASAYSAWLFYVGQLTAMESIKINGWIKKSDSKPCREMFVELSDEDGVFFYEDFWKKDVILNFWFVRAYISSKRFIWGRLLSMRWR